MYADEVSPEDLFNMFFGGGGFGGGGFNASTSPFFCNSNMEAPLQHSLVVQVSEYILSAGAEVPNNDVPNNNDNKKTPPSYINSFPSLSSSP